MHDKTKYSEPSAPLPSPTARAIKRSGNFPYRFKISTDYRCESGWQLPEAFDATWLTISTMGTITVKANDNGYAWDGCTPKISALNVFIVGVPDGHINYRTMKPYTYYASLVHDALYQYLDTVPVSKKKIDGLFLTMLGDFKLRWLYYGAVRLLGGVGVTQQGIKTITH